MKKIKDNILHDPILKIVTIILIIMIFIGMPRINDINFTTILTLFTMMMLVSIIKDLSILNFFSNYIINISHSIRQVVFLMTILSFFGSMLVTNDIAIITLVPLYIEIAANQNLPIPYPVTLITIAANLGSSVTPFGNPQNVFLLSYYHLSINQFFNPAFIVLLLGIIILLILLSFVSNKKMNSNNLSVVHLNYRKCFPVIILIIFIFLGIFSIINLWIPFLITLIYGSYINRSTIINVDYSLLLSFIGFFLIVGILSRNQLVISNLSLLLKTPHQVFFSGALISQIISNVPGSVLIAKFTRDFYSLYLGVNIGGLGSLVASLANLLAFKQIQIYSNKDSWSFLRIFTFTNVVLLLLTMIIISFLI
ncbi:SLC13 family permease [Apilactobacillus quenuiae]|uniref:SLC13 family permease n=1 Tax=Apilactobacillus quenuiae TaxID=2008377 RepID=UPI000D01BFC2|nr:SLC13 family permease [Apilactobacillus quenuiae]